MLAAILSLIILPFIVDADVRSSDFRPLMKFTFWLFVVVTFILGWIGAKPIAYPFLIIGQVATFMYFFILLVLFPFVSVLERVLWKE